ncbi:hypothetical protein Tco_0452702 [Tanacetum coccineum]
MENPVTCCVCEGPLNGGFCSFCASRARNSFAYDPNPNSFNDSPSVFTHPTRLQFETYLCELCGNDAHYGYDCPPQFPLELAEYINLLSWNRPAYYYEDDDEEYTIVITPDLPNEKPDNSLSMGDEHLSTIPETESNEVIKSSVENLVQISSESEDLSDIESECDVPVCDNFTTSSNPLFDSEDKFSSSDDESFSDEDIPKEIYSNPLFEEEIISTKIDRHHFNVESDLIESLLNHDTSIISSPEINSLLEEFFGELTHINLIPPGINEADFDPKEGIRLVEKLLYDNSSPRPPAKPPDDDEIKPDTGVFTKVVDDISNNSTRELYVHVPNVLPNLPTLCLVIDTLLPFSSENEDKVHLLSHRRFKAFQFFF